MDFRRERAVVLAAGLVIFSGFGAAGAERDDWARRVEAGRRSYETYAARAWENFAAHNSAFRRPTLPQSQNATTDPTLQRGDIVMTERGMIVFAGAARFVALHEWRGDEAHRTDLLEMERASKVVAPAESH